jgi:hypothetical protein
MPINMSLQNGVGYLTELSAIQLSRLPTSFPKVALNFPIASEELVLEIIRDPCKVISQFRLSLAEGSVR